MPANALSDSLESGSVTTVNGDAIEVDVSDGGITVNGASVIQADVIASNGVIHVIDAVLFPPEEPEEQEAAQTTESPPITFTTEEPEVELTTESPATDAPEDEHEVEPVPPPPATTEAPGSGADAMLGKSAKSKVAKAKCGKSKSSKGGPSGVSGPLA